MRVVSLNCWGGRVHGPLIDYLSQVGADVLCLQEVTRTEGEAPQWLAYRDAGVELAQRAHLFDEVAAVLPDHDAIFAPAARGELHDGDRTVPSRFGLATFVHRRHSLLDQALGFVHGAFEPEGWGPHPRARNAHAIRLWDHDAGLPVTVAHMHGLRDLAGKGDTPARRAQAEALAALVPRGGRRGGRRVVGGAGLVRRVWREGERLVVCGDFNVLPDSETFAILGGLGLRDLVTGLGHGDTRTSLYPKPGRFADYLLVTDRVRIRAFDVVARPEVSDHRPLLLDLD